MLFFQKNNFKIFVIALLYLNTRSIQALRILALFPFQARSHYVMCEELMKGLAARGHQVDVYSHFPPDDASPSFEHFSLKDSLPPLSNNLAYDDVVHDVSLRRAMIYWLQGHGNRICELMEQPLLQKLIHDPPKNQTYDLVITEISVSYCYLAWGKYLNIPIIGIVTFPLPDWMYGPFGTPLNSAVDPSVFSPYVAPMTFLERLDNVMISTLYNFYFHQLIGKQEEYIEKYFKMSQSSIGDLMRDVSLILVNYDPIVSGMRPFTPGVVPVGGLHVVDRNEILSNIVQDWLDGSEHGCIYFTFGSMTRIETFPIHIIEAFYKSFENIAPVRVIMKIAKPQELPAGLPSNVLIQPWFQQMQILKHKNVKAFVTHGGLMGTQESIYNAVPMVGIPLFADQHFNIKAYVKKGIAVYVDFHQITEETFTNALKEILYDVSYKKNVEKISRQSKDRPMSLMDTATFWVEYVHRHGKDALRNPVVDMAWWQARLFDVYGFIAVIVVLAITITVKLLKIVIELLCILLRHRTFKSKSKNT